MPAPDIGVVGYTKTLGKVRATRVAVWERPRLALVAGPETTMGGKA
jgi:hypothetical protein